MKGPYSLAVENCHCERKRQQSRAISVVMSANPDFAVTSSAAQRHVTVLVENAASGLVVLFDRKEADFPVGDVAVVVRSDNALQHLVLWSSLSGSRRGTLAR